MSTDTGLPEVPAAQPEEAPAPEAPQVEPEDRIARIENTVETLANAIGQIVSRATPPTTGIDPAATAQAEEFRQNLEAEAANNPVLRQSLTISQGLYNHMQAENAKLQARLDLAEIDDPEEKKATKAAWETGDFRTVEAARRAAKGDLQEKRPAPKPEPDPEKQRREVEKVRSTDASPRGVGAPEFKRRMNDKDYTAKVGDSNLPMEERVRLRRERAGIPTK